MSTTLLRPARDEDIVYLDSDPNDSKLKVVGRKLAQGLHTLTGWMQGQTGSSTEPTESTEVKEGSSHHHQQRGAFEGNVGAAVKMGIVVVIMLVCCGFMFSRHEGEAHISYFDLTSVQPEFLRLRTPLNVVRLKLSAASTETSHSINSTLLRPKPDDSSSSSSGSEDYAMKKMRFMRSTDSESENSDPDVFYMYNVSLTVYGKKSEDLDEWIAIRTDCFVSVATSARELSKYDFTFTQEEIDRYHSNLMLELVLVNATDDKPPTEDGQVTIKYIDEPFVAYLEVIYMPKAGENEVAIAFVILILVYGMIVVELYHRALAAMLGSFMAVAALSYLQHRPTFHDVTDWIDFDTVGVLFGMMVMVGILSTTGVFEYCAVKAYKMSNGDIWKLTLLLCCFTGIVSAFLDNVTTILLIAPVTLRLCEVLEISPVNMLLLEVMFSNIGGTATPIGDPPNIIIVSDRKIQSAGVADFLSFVVHVAPGICLSGYATMLFAKHFLFKEEAPVTNAAEAGRHMELNIWKKTVAKLHGESEEEKKVREQLEEHIRSIEAELESTPVTASNSKEEFIRELEEKYQIHNMKLFKISAVVMGAVILMFFLHALTHIPMVWIAIIGALIHLVTAEVHHLEEVLEKVEFATLLFFAALFVLMKGLEELGLIEFIGETTAHIIRGVPEGNGRLTVAILLILWVSSFVSAFIDNIPYTTTMIPVVVKLSTDNLGLPLAPLIWALVYGACLGGNGTIIGASANVVASGIAEQNGVHISYMTFLKIGMPTMIFSSITCTVYLLITHVWWGWY